METTEANLAAFPAEAAPESTTRLSPGFSMRASAENSRLMPVVTLVLWLGCSVVSVLGLTMPGAQAGQLQISGTAGPLDAKDSAQTPLDAHIKLDQVELASLEERVSRTECAVLLVGREAHAGEAGAGDRELGLAGDAPAHPAVQHTPAAAGEAPASTAGRPTRATGGDRRRSPSASTDSWCTMSKERATPHSMALRSAPIPCRSRTAT